MLECVRLGCPNLALGDWWTLCVECTLPLTDPLDLEGAPQVEQRQAAGWDALQWAERIAPDAWGNANGVDEWIRTQRCTAFAAVVTGRAEGCMHTLALVAAPVVAVARAP